MGLGIDEARYDETAAQVQDACVLRQLLDVNIVLHTRNPFIVDGQKNILLDLIAPT
ncbi:hypothetical protein NOR51B_978 [Luminiphilus syltensis NOR5-1B]|uniref:Uncharacterized protein n=1 Tax=Luminiphilus syltensis NOR5-1B TaxID=565045 RepID=B8KUC1_9GAMM|nr:hypothetical protein NOR51B_978 [Luminiphilus syltensis NOR5-1B]